MTRSSTTTCLVAGGGPAGVMAGFLLARAGIDVVVLEKHADFLRDFRGDTIHPSTLELMHELGLLESLLKRPHQDVSHGELDLAGRRLRLADFTHLPVVHPRIVFMPQWEFLDFLAQEASRYPGFTLRMEAEAVGLIREGVRTTGLRVRTARGDEEEIHARALVIAAEGRDSRLRDQADLTVKDLGAPMDVMWFELGVREGDEVAVLGRIERGQALVMLHRGDYWQCALIIRKGAAEAVRAQGLAAFRSRIAGLTERSRVDEITDWEDVRLLTVRVDHLEDWYEPGLLFIGDAAHAMSPIGGVGINLAIQDAVAVANLLYEPLRRGEVSDRDLARVQRRRTFPTWATQKLQTTIQDRFVEPILEGVAPRVAWPLRLMQTWPWLQRLPARAIGLGFRPEHVRSPHVAASAPAGSASSGSDLA